MSDPGLERYAQHVFRQQDDEIRLLREALIVAREYVLIHYDIHKAGRVLTLISAALDETPAISHADSHGIEKTEGGAS